jgi:5-methylcytosine-specific restriction enzyme A
MPKLHLNKPRLRTLNDPRRVKSVNVRPENPIYASPRWRKFIAAIKAARGPYCQGRDHQGNRHVALLNGDHIIELKDGGEPFDPRNIQLLCQSCHNKKTAREQVRRASGRTIGDDFGFA